MTHKNKIRLAACGTFALITVAAASIHQYLTNINDIPLPFANHGMSTVTGDLTKIGYKGADVYRVTFPAGVNSESLTHDQIYLVAVPNEATTMTMDEALAAGGVHDVDYFGYKYVNPDAATEKSHRNDAALKARFPGQFFASHAARLADAGDGNALANFESANGVTFDPTDTTAGAKLEKNSLYFLIVNDNRGATITVRIPALAACTEAECGLPRPAGASIVCNDGSAGGLVCSRDPNGFCGWKTVDCIVVCGFTPSGGGTQCEEMTSTNCVGTYHGTAYVSVSECNAGAAQRLCGNGTKEGTEECDAGTANGQVCDSVAGGTCTYCSSTCTNVTVHGAASAVCGDGSLDQGETCDDQNTTAGDGCSATCTVESNFHCDDASPSVCSCIAIADCAAPPPGCHYDSISACGVCGQLVCTQTCGNSVREGSEGCDNGSANGQVCEAARGGSCTYCSASCANVTVQGVVPACGDGIFDQGETCDDGNTTAGDGCGSACAVESNFSCTRASPSVCITYNAFVKNIADANHNGTVTDNEALLLTLDLADAPSKPYDIVKKFDINQDGVVDNADVTAIFAELDILAP